MGQHISRYRVEQAKEASEASRFVPGEVLKRWCEEGKNLGTDAHSYYKASRLLYCIRVGFPVEREHSQKVTECVPFYTDATSFEHTGKSWVDIGFATRAKADEALKKQLYLDNNSVPRVCPCLLTETLCLLVLRNIPSTLSVPDTEQKLGVGLKAYGRVLAYHVEKDPKLPTLTVGNAYAALAVPVNNAKPIPKEAFFRGSPAEKFTVICHVQHPNPPPSYSPSDRAVVSSRNLSCWGE